MTKAGRGDVVGDWRITEMETWDADYYQEARKASAFRPGMNSAPPLGG